MNEQLDLVVSQLRMVWLYRWVVLLVALVLSAAGTVYVYSLPNQYQVSAMLFVDTRSMLRSLLRGMTVDMNAVASAANLMKQTLLTRPTLEEIARRADMDLKTRTPQEFDNVVSGLGRSIRISSTKRQDIFEIAYSHNDPRHAKKLVDEVLNIFLESTLGDSRRDKVVTEKFLDEQIAEDERRLIEAEERLKEFKQRNVGVMPGAQMDYFGRMQSARSELQEAQLALEEAQKRRDEIRRQLEAAKGGGDLNAATDIGDLAGFGGMPETQYDARIENLHMKLDELLLNFTDKHPDVIGLRNTIAELETRRDEELKQLVAAGPDDSGNPVVQQLRLVLTEAEGNVAALTGRVERLDKRVQQLGRMVDTVPEVEAELKRLDRDYNLNKAQHNKLLERRESMRLSQQAQDTADQIQLKVIEPPRVPLTPTGPPRLLYLSAAFGMSLGAGAALAWLIAQVRPRVFTTRELKQLFGVPVLGSISRVGSRWANPRYRLEHGAFALGACALIGVYLGLVTLEFMDVDLHSKVVALAGGLL